MDVSRRAVLSGLLVPLVATPRISLGFEENAKTLFVLLDGITDNLPLDLAEQVFEIFFANGIPITVPVRCLQEEDGAIPGWLKDIAARERGLFEIALEMDTPEDAERYFQLRAAIDLRDCVSSTGSEDDSADEAPIVSIMDRTAQDSLDPYALRAAGFRVIIHPGLADDAAQSTYEPIDWGIAQLQGGDVADIGDDPEIVSEMVASSRQTPILYLSFQSALQLQPGALLARCAAWASRLQNVMLEENFFPTRPMDHLLQGHPGGSKYVGLVLDMAEKAGEPSLQREFAILLEQANFPYTALVDATDSPISDAVEKCVLSLDESGSTSDKTPLCITISIPDSGAEDTTAEIVLRPSNGPPLWNGPRSDGRYHASFRLGETGDFGRSIEIDPLTDAILLIGEDQIATPVQQEALIADLLQARRDGKASFYTLREYMEQTLAPDPVLRRFWSTRRRQASDPPEPQALSDEDREAFMDDARLAWQYIERFSDEATGICAGTVLVSNAKIVNQWVALWDVASQLRGVLAAADLSLISVEDARTRVGRVLENLPSISVDGHALPPALFRADNPEASRPDFNACDTGRFLLALAALVDAGLVAKARAQEVVDQWDLSASVQERKPFDFSSGEWRDASRSHCTHYSRNGYAAWGMPVDQVYPALEDGKTGDQNIRLLYSAANIGHFGTEPLLLEALEIGHSSESRYLSEVLFDAQLSWFEETGRYKCVSEAPLNFAPWFSYQGLRVDRSGQESWVISTLGNDAAYQTERFFNRAELISAKAAYMWAVERPHAYSSALLSQIRQKARLDGLGFSVGVFSQTLKAMPGYSDVNTNGIILTAISKILAES